MTDELKPKSTKRKSPAKPKKKKELPAESPASPQVNLESAVRTGHELEDELERELVEVIEEDAAPDGSHEGQHRKGPEPHAHGEIKGTLEDELERELVDAMEEEAAPEGLPEGELESELEGGPAELAGPAGLLEGLLEGEPESELEGEAPGELEGGLEGELQDEAEPEFTPKPRPPAKLERLQKILAQAGVASRRKAEEMIEQGRVQVNGKVVTELGTKADAGRDHIRVDGKLLQGAERLRYFVLNKPRGFVTTVKDPEGRPTVMQFFDKMRERLYPVGRLDYMSEGLLLVTNDGELANRLTRAAAGVEKTYLVKVAGQPSEAELDILRGGVAIERGKPGSDRVRTSPARIRQVRQGDNPWYEVVLIEGRNRELRKMFEEIGHFVEKIRRVGYGPLVLDQEPGNLRELRPNELDALRKTADGTLRTPKSKELRRRNAMDAAGLPTVTPRPTRHPRPAKPPAKPFEERPAAGELSPRKSLGTERPIRSSRPLGEESRRSGKDFRPVPSRSTERGPARGPARDSARGPARPDDRLRRDTGSGPARYGSARPSSRPTAGPAKYGSDRPARPAFQKDNRSTRPPERFAAGASGKSSPETDRPRGGGAPESGRTGAGRTFGAKPAWNKPAGRGDRPAYQRPAGPRRDVPARDMDSGHEDSGPVRPPNLHIEEIQPSDRHVAGRSSTPRPYADRPSPSRPFRSEGGLPRAFTTSSGKPRPGGARPSSKPGVPADRSSSAGWKPGKPAGRSYGSGAGQGSGSRPARPFAPRPEGASESRFPNTKKFAGQRSDSPRGERNAGSGWKPKTRYGGPGKPASGGRSNSKPGGFSKSGYKGKPAGSGPKRTGPRPGGKTRG